jgi:hypothetical protein
MLLAAQVACQAHTDIRNPQQPPSTVAATRASADDSVAPASSTFGVKVSGNKLVSTADGSTLLIIGANISGLETGTASRWPPFAAAGADGRSRPVR